MASRIRGNVDLIVDEKGGLLANSHSAPEFARAILRLQKDPGLCKRMGGYNRKRVRLFDRAKVRSVMEKVYQEVLR